MYCNHCGKVIQEDAVHCAYCGRQVGAIYARKRLMRSRNDRSIAGVCAGLAEYFDLDVSAIRVAWALTVVFFGCGLLAYVIAWVVIPEEPVMQTVVPPVQGGTQQRA